MRTAAAYLRVSDERQDEFSPDSQLKLIRQYCQTHEICLPNDLIFYDDGISAKSTQKRARFNEMIALAKCEQKPFQMILVWKFSRFARNQEESIVYKSLLRRHGVEVVSVSEPLADNPFGTLVERIIEWMDEYYLIRLGDEVRRGMTERAIRGLPNVPPPYGYRMESGTYAIEAKEAETVRAVFAWFLQGKTISGIARDLKALGIKNKRGNFFDPRGIDYILHNPCYAGKLRYNPNERSASARKFNNPNDILSSACHPPIVTEELFSAAQIKLQERTKGRTKYARDSAKGSPFALKGLVHCDTCGATLVYQKAKHGVQCHQYAKGICKISHFISLSLLDKMLREALRKILPDLSFPITQRSWEKPNTERANEPSQRVALAEILESTVLSEELKNIVLKALLQKIVFYRPQQKISLFFYS